MPDTSARSPICTVDVVLLTLQQGALHVALLRRDGESGTWTLVDHAIGPADVAWLTWPTKHAVPRQLFGF